jgi:DNA-binding response OmpR family regulator
VKFLILDDEISDIIATIIKRKGHTTFTAKTIEEARDIVSKEKIDVALLDIKLSRRFIDLENHLLRKSKESGIEFIGEAKKAGSIVIVVSAYFTETIHDIEEKLIKLGADGFLRKPFSINEVLLKISGIKNG